MANPIVSCMLAYVTPFVKCTASPREPEQLGWKQLPRLAGAIWWGTNHAWHLRDWVRGWVLVFLQGVCQTFSFKVKGAPCWHLSLLTVESLETAKLQEVRLRIEREKAGKPRCGRIKSRQEKWRAENLIAACKDACKDEVGFSNLICGSNNSGQSCGNCLDKALVWESCWTLSDFSELLTVQRKPEWMSHKATLSCNLLGDAMEM